MLLRFRCAGRRQARRPGSLRGCGLLLAPEAEHSLESGQGRCVGGWSGRWTRQGRPAGTPSLTPRWVPCSQVLRWLITWWTRGRNSSGSSP